MATFEIADCSIVTENGPGFLPCPGSSGLQENAVAGDDLEQRNAIGTPSITAAFNDQLRVVGP